MNKNIIASAQGYKALLSLDVASGVISDKDGAVTNLVCDKLKESTGFEWNAEALEKTTKTLTDETTAILTAGAEMSAEGFKSSEENDKHRIEVSLSKNAMIEAGWDRSKTSNPRNPKTGEPMGERTNYNTMSGGSLALKGSVKPVREYSKTFGNELLGE